MNPDKYPFAVRLAGFAPQQAAALAAVLRGAPAAGPDAALPPLPERRRRGRLDFDLTDPADYAAMRRSAAVSRPCRKHRIFTVCLHPACDCLHRF